MLKKNYALLMCFQEESFLKLHKDWPGRFDKFKGKLENYKKNI